MIKGNPHYQPNYGDYYQHLEWYEPSASTSLWLENTKRGLAQTTYKYRTPINVAAAAAVTFMTAQDYWNKQKAIQVKEEATKQKRIAEDARTELIKKQYMELVRQRNQFKQLEPAPPGFVPTHPATTIPSVEEPHVEEVEVIPDTDDITIRPPQRVVPTFVDPNMPRYEIRLPMDYYIDNIHHNAEKMNQFASDMKPLVAEMGMTRLLEFVGNNYPEEAKWFVPMFSSNQSLQESLRNGIPFPESWLDTLPNAAAKRIRGLYHPTYKTVKNPKGKPKKK